MYTGTTKSGFAFEIEETALDNMELVDALAEAEEDPLSLSRVVRLLLGKEDRKRLYNHIRTEQGNVPIDAMSEELKQIFAACGTAGKN